MLRNVKPARLDTPPPLPVLPLDRREMWLRLMCAHHIDRSSWPGSRDPDWQAGSHPNPDERARLAVDWARTQSRPLVYAAANWSARAVTQQWLNEELPESQVRLSTTETLILTLAASSVRALKRLAGIHRSAVAVDGLHRLDPQGITPVLSLLEDLHAWGTPMFLTAPVPHPYMTVTPEHTVGMPRWADVRYHAECHDVQDLAQAVRAEPDMTTLLMLPSRKAALIMQAEFPEGRLLTRSKTLGHLKAEGGDPQRLTISTWSPTATNFEQYQRVLTARLPLPILADACLSAEQVSVYPTTAFDVTGTLRACTSFSSDLLRAGRHPQDARAMNEYWAEISRYQTDGKGIQQIRAALNYQQTSVAVASLFRGGVDVVVASPEAQAISRTSGPGGAAARLAQMSVKMTQTSVRAALESGLAEIVDDVVVWSGPYTSERGVGVP